MSKEALAKVVQRAISDGAFRRQLSSDPATALRGFDLSPDESAAIRSGDAGRLTAMGVELRMSKAFTLSSDNAPAMGGNSVLSNDLGASFTGAVNSGVNSAGNAALISGVNSAGNSALLSGVNSAGNASLDAGMNSAAGNAALISGVNSGTNLSQPILTDANDGYLTSVHTGGDNAMNDVLVVDDNAISGAASPGEANDGPNISQ